MMKMPVGNTSSNIVDKSRAAARKYNVESRVYQTIFTFKHQRRSLDDLADRVSFTRSLNQIAQLDH